MSGACTRSRQVKRGSMRSLTIPNCKATSTHQQYDSALLPQILAEKCDPDSKESNSNCSQANDPQHEFSECIKLTFPDEPALKVAWQSSETFLGDGPCTSCLPACDRHNLQNILLVSEHASDCPQASQAIKASRQALSKRSVTCLRELHLRQMVSRRQSETRMDVEDEGASELGTHEYWEAAYAREFDNLRYTGDEGEVW